MELGICSFASGSSGNCYLIKSENTNLILDAGLSAKRICEGLAACGTDPKEVGAILITHEHIDHVKGLQVFTKKAPVAKILMSVGTGCALARKSGLPAPERMINVGGGETFLIGDIYVTAISLSHDADEPLGYTFEKNGRKIAVITDTGYITEEIYENIKDADLLVLEANHERNILLMGKYPYPLKHRILSDIGHLSNEAAALCLQRILREPAHKQELKVLLAHLSQENNTPHQALITIKNILEEGNFYEGSHYHMEVAPRDCPGRLIEL